MIITVFKKLAVILQMSFSTLSSSDIASAGSTKYDINSTPTDKAWERVKKNAAKTIKKKTVRQKNRTDNNIMSEVSEVSTLVQGLSDRESWAWKIE